MLSNIRLSLKEPHQLCLPENTIFQLTTPRSRVQAIDERWEEVNVRATNTLENIEEDDLDEKDPGRRRRDSNPAVDKRREAGMLVVRGKFDTSCVVCGSHEAIGSVMGYRILFRSLLLMEG